VQRNLEGAVYPGPVNDYEYLMQSREATFDQRIGGARH